MGATVSRDNERSRLGATSVTMTAIADSDDGDSNGEMD
jgi:hypothetical protein